MISTSCKANLMEVIAYKGTYYQPIIPLILDLGKSSRVKPPINREYSQSEANSMGHDELGSDIIVDVLVFV